MNTKFRIVWECHGEPTRSTSTLEESDLDSFLEALDASIENEDSSTNINPQLDNHRGTIQIQGTDISRHQFSSWDRPRTQPGMSATEMILRVTQLVARLGNRDKRIIATAVPKIITKINEVHAAGGWHIPPQSGNNWKKSPNGKTENQARIDIQIFRGDAFL